MFVIRKIKTSELKMQARFMIFRALEEAIKKDHDTVSWIKIVDSCLQQVSIEPISKVEGISIAIAIIGSKRLDLYPTAARFLCDWQDTGGPIQYMKEEVLRFATIYLFRCKLCDKDQNNLEAIISMRRVLDTILPKEAQSVRVLRSEFNWLLNDIVGLTKCKMKSALEESVAKYPLQQFVPWFIRWGLDILCRFQIVTLQRYCGSKIPYQAYPTAQSNKRSIADTASHSSTGITLFGKEKNFLTEIHQDESEVTLADSYIPTLDNEAGDCDETSRDLHTKSVVNAKSNCSRPENRPDGDTDLSESSNNHKSLKTTALNSCAESSLNSLDKALTTSNKRVKSHASTIATTKKGNSISTRIDTKRKEFSLKRKRSGYGLPKNSSRHTKEKPISSTRTIGIMNADIVAQTSEKDPWNFFPATSTIARSKQYGKSVPISPLTDSSHSV